jgi:hypothetical protein
MLHSHRDLYVRGGRQAEDFSRVEIAKDLRTLGIRALGQHGALLPAVRSKLYAGAAADEVTADTKSGDRYHLRILATAKLHSPLVYNRLRNVYSQSMFVECGLWLLGRFLHSV